MHHALLFVATAYAPGCGDSGRTATGTRPHVGTAAVDPRIIPLNRNFFMKGMYFHSRRITLKAEDTGGDIKGRRLDVWFPTCAEANDFGREPVKVWIPDL
jgi:3D (Asp-Asp-Asp) domain-containing protein